MATPSRIAAALAWVLVILTIPVLVIDRAAETPTLTARRLAASGLPQAAIAERLGVTRYRVRKMLTA
jgi:hypothetical protein